MGRFDGKVAIVTGGTSGIGFATAKAFADEGAFVFITGRREDALEAAVARIGRRATGVAGDVSTVSDIDRLYEEVQRQHQQVDMIFANAGGGSFAPLGAIDEAHFDAIFASNVKGTLFTVQKALPLLRDGSAIILNSSTTGSHGTPALSVYAAAKAAVRSFARNWILDLKHRRIRVNAISPGLTETDGLNELFGGGAQAEDVKTSFIDHVPIGRLGQVEDVAQAVLFLTSDAASYINGIELSVDGGMGQI